MDEFEVTCPYCGEIVVVHLEEDVRGSFVYDCEVCCNPWLLRLTRSADGRDLTVSRADGSD
jgi:transposase-like protein